MLDTIILVLAGFLAGVLNTVAGGGTFLTFPALVWAGLPPVAANATSAVAVFPGYLAGVAGFRREIGALPRGLLLRMAGATLGGRLLGSLLLLVSSNEAFGAVVPFLLAFATLAFALGDRLRAWASRHAALSERSLLGPFLVAVYGGYFNGGLGIVLLALFSLQGMRDMGRMNGLKNGLSFLLSAISVATFAVAGLVAWPQAAAMMIASTLGGYLGAPRAAAARSARPRHRRGGGDEPGLPRAARGWLGSGLGRAVRCPAVSRDVSYRNRVDDCRAARFSVRRES